MKLFAAALRQLDRLKRQGVDSASLQFRLTLGITTASLLGVVSIGTFTTWEMRQMLVDKHKDYLEDIAATLPHRLAATSSLPSSSRFASAQQVKQAIDSFAATDLWLWVQSPNRQVLAQSANLNTFPTDATQLTPSDVAPQPKVTLIRDRYLILCAAPLQVRGQTLGQLYLARDITHDYTVLTTLVKSLIVGMALAIAAIGLFVSLWIWRSLNPLRQMNRLASANVQHHSSENLSWEVDQVPSEVKELVHAFSALSVRLSEAGEQQRQFTNSMSHELRTSLSLVYGYLQSTLRRSDNLTDPQRESLEVAISETERTIRLLKDLLDLARASSGVLEVEMKPLILNDLVAEFARQERITIDIRSNDDIASNLPYLDSVSDSASDSNSDSASDSNSDSEPDSNSDSEPDSTLIIVKADRNHLKRALQELITNALRYSNADTSVTLQLYQDAHWAWLAVIDRGDGIAPEHQPHIFEPFYRTDDSRSRLTGGIGLGLAIAHSLITVMNGQLTAQSTPNVGSIFRIKLPIWQV